jgi:hypothetical protein
MPENLSESVSGSTELVFPDDAGGSTYSLRERSVYDAEEVRLEIEADIPQYGSWLPVELDDTGTEAWVSAPSQLRSALVEDEIRPGERFRIETMQKTGHDQSAPYEVRISYPDRETGPGDQTSLKEA